jgi:hypothetical protein
MNYYKIYYSIIESRKRNKYVGYTECHHILPRCLGGSDDKDNLVNLSAKEHFICHLLLTKMYTVGTNEYYKMCHAFMMMLVSNKSQSRYITSKRYVSLKEGHSIRMSDLQRGIGNSQYGKKWITNYNLRENKSVDKNSVLEDGWVDGRIDWKTFDARESAKNEKIRLAEIKKLEISSRVKINKHKIHQDKLNEIDWDFMYELYQMYGFDIAKSLTNYDMTRAAMLMQFKKRVINYRPSQKTKRISEDKYVKEIG